uniref:Glutaredoxin-like protein n=1 Tax=Diabrotica virgifera virgifera TaxID=50390 RepID=A0A6P7G3F4_DIAVI
RCDDLPSGERPTLTLYTKEPCPLCDELKLELNPYMSRINFSTVDISKKENLRYLRLYRYEIPVVFLNGQYLCKHRLDKNLLDYRLQEIESRR